MIKTLILLRHGKSDKSKRLKDFDRPLTNRGKHDAQRMGVWIAQQNLVPDQVISSPAVRAALTAEKSLKAMCCASEMPKEIEYNQQLYLSSIKDHIDLIKQAKKNTQTLMLVGHNPSFKSLLKYLSADKLITPKKTKRFPSGSLAVFEFNSSSSKNKKKKKRHNKTIKRSALLKSLVRPKSLPRTFPFPLATSEEQRIRPAYYYTQSGVIPYRIKNSKLQILVISSSKNNHYVLPKGIKEPYLSLQQSAEKEAFEEAGVKGIISDQAIGTYVYSKWEADCHVTMYPMLVNKLISNSKWEEAHRGRKWLCVDAAIKSLKQQQLKPMILTFENSLLAQEKLNSYN